MAWDNSRPVPWERLIREWLVYAAIMVAVFLVFFRGDNVVGAIAGVLISGPLYLGFGAVLAKFGYTRKRLKDLRAESKQPPEKPGRAATTATSGDNASPDGPREKPAPTRRTSGGGQRPTSKNRRR